MKRLRFILPIAVLVAVLAAANVYAGSNWQSFSILPQDSDTSLTVTETIPVTANVEVQLNGQTYMLAVPATLSVDALVALGDARIMSENRQRVGILEWNILAIEEYEEEYQLSQFTNVTVSSPDNKIVVVRSEAKNLGNQPFDSVWDFQDESAYDALGNVYESERKSCNDINPGATQRCVIAFDVPADTTIVGLDLAVVDRRRIPFVGEAE